MAHLVMIRRLLILHVVVSILALPNLVFPQTTPGLYTRGTTATVVVPDSFFVEQLLFPGALTNPTALAFPGGGRLLVAGKEGRVWIWKEGQRSPEVFLDISEEVYSNGQRGLADIVVHPDIEGKSYIYLLYTVSEVPDNEVSGAFARIVRYEFDVPAYTVLSESRTVLLGEGFADGIPACTALYGPGRLHFGLDGSLLVATSDAADHNQFDSGGLHPQCFGEGRFGNGEDIGAFRSQSLSSLSGKLLRLDPETGHGLPDNPLYTGAGSNASSKIWALGLREPVGIIPLISTGSESDQERLLLADRGWNAIEEMNLSDRGGQNYGWPCVDGFSPADSYTDVPLADTFCSEEASASRPVMWWHHQNPAFSNPPGIGGTLLAGGAQYRGARYPSFYNNRIFYADLSRGWVATASVDMEGLPLDQRLFSSNVGALTEIAYNPYDQYIYFLDSEFAAINRLRHEREIEVIHLDDIDQHIEVAGNGLYGVYYDEIDFSGDYYVRVDSALVYESFALPEPNDFKAVRWEGFIVPDFDENYMLHLVSNGSSRLWLNDSLVIDLSSEDASGIAEERTGQATLAMKGGVSYRVQLTHHSDNAALQVGLEWSSNSQRRQPIPFSRLTHGFHERINLCRTLQATVSMSSSLSAFAEADNACDGNTNGDFFEGSVAVTQREEHPFLEVDLGQVRDIDEIRLWNRTDCCMEALNGAFILVSKYPFAANDLSVLAQEGVSAYLVSEVPDPLYTRSVFLPGRYVRVQHAHEESLHLAEIEILAGVGNEAGAPPVEGLVSWWSFEDELSDRRGNNDGIARDGADVLPDEIRQRVLDLDGENDWVEVPHADILNGTHSLTYAAWIKPESWAEQSVIVSKASEKGGQMRLSASTGLLVGQVETADQVYFVRSPLPQTSEWNHVAVVFDGSSLSLYINGLLQDETRFSYSSLILTDSPFQIGTQDMEEDTFFHGRLDDVVLYNSALNSSDLLRLIDAASNVVVEDERDNGFHVNPFEIESAFPNPFSLQVTLTYRMDGWGRVRGDIYDSLGRRIRSLDEGMKGEGRHTYIWDGADEAGRRVGAGMYVIRLESNGHAHTALIVRI